MLAKIFLTPDNLHQNQRRLRAGWRLLIQLVVMTAILVAWELLVWQIARYPSLASDYALLASQAGSFIAINLSIYLARRFLDRRSLASLGMTGGRRAVRELLAGFLIAGVMMLLIYFIQRAAGWLTIEGFAWQTTPVWQTLLATLIMFLVFILVGWQEEMLARGYWLQNLEEGLNLFWAVLLSSALFASGHLFNPNMGWLPGAGLFLAGLFLAYAYLRTRRLWLPIGLHIGWNFFEGTVLGFPVSGMNLFGLMNTSIKGPVLFTGGAFGPEAGLVLLPALALGTILVYYYTRLEPTHQLSNFLKEEPKE